MVGIVKALYSVLAEIMLFFIYLPGGELQNNGVMVFSGALVFVTVAMILIFRAIRVNSESYSFLIRLSVVASLILVISRYVILKIHGDFDGYGMSSGEAVIMLGIFSGVILFTIINFVLESGKGEVTVLLMLIVFLVTSAIIRVWNYSGGVKNNPSYKTLMVFARITDPFEAFVEKAGLMTVISLLEFVILMGCMFFSVLLLYNCKNSIPAEWGLAMVSQIAPAIGYMIFEAHSGIEWNPVNAFVIFLVIGAGDILYLFVFLFELVHKEQESVIGAFNVILGGCALRIAAVIGTDLAARSHLGKVIGTVAGLLTKLYNIIPVGKHTSFADGGLILALIGICIVIVLAVILIMVIFFILGKALDYEQEGAGMTMAWYRNCAMLMIIPFMVYWLCSSYKNVFGDMFEILIVMLRSMVCLGFALSLANIAPSLLKFQEALGQLKLVVVSTLVSTLFTCVFTTIIMHMI